VAQKHILRGSQADRIISKFGGPPRLYEALKLLAETEHNPDITRDVATIYRWLYPRSRGGTDGVIPTSAQRDVQRAARLQGILITAEDWFGA